MAQAVDASMPCQGAAQGADEGDRDAAADELRMYMPTLMIGTPVLIDATESRNFLEQAQTRGRMAVALGATARRAWRGTGGRPARRRGATAPGRLGAAAGGARPEVQAAIRGRTG